MSIHLYEIAEARRILDQFLAETEGEETPAIAELFAELDGSLEKKGEAIALWIREKEAEAAALKLEGERIAKKRKARDNAIASSKEYFARILTELGKTEAGTTLAKLALQNNPPSLAGEIAPTDLADLSIARPDLVKIVPASASLDRKAALDCLKAGGEIPGLSIARTQSLRVR